MALSKEKIEIERDIKKYRERFEQKFIIVPECSCWIWIGSSKPNGYGDFWFRGAVVGAHRVSYILYKNELSDGTVVCHKCDVRYCVNPDHLFEGTTSDNLNDAVSKQRFVFSNARLTFEQAQEVRVSPLSKKDLMSKYGVSRSTIERIKSGQHYNKRFKLNKFLLEKQSEKSLEAQGFKVKS